MSQTRAPAAPATGASQAPGRPSPYLTFGATTLAAALALGAAWGLQRLGLGWAAVLLVGGVLTATLASWRMRGRVRTASRGPWWLHWDVVGYAASLAVAGAATIVAAETIRSGPELLRTTRMALPVAAWLLVFVGVAGLALLRRESSLVRRAPRKLVQVWTDPPADWAYFVLGAVTSLPLAALLGPVAPDTDSTRLLLSTSQARQEGLGFLLRTQQVFLPVLLYTPVVAVAGIYGATALSVATMQALTGVVGYITRKLTAGVIAPIAAMLTLLLIGTMTVQAGLLPMYPLMFALGYFAGWVGLRALRAEGRMRVVLAILTGFLFAATAEAHDIGKLFFAVPAFLLILEPSRKGVRAVMLIYAALAVFYTPRVAVNLAEGGFDRFFVNRDDWMTGQGYLRMINLEFWQHSILDKPGFFGQMFEALIRPPGWLIIVPAGLVATAFGAARWRARLFGLTCAGVMFYLLFRARIPPHARYMSPVLPGAAIAAGAGLWIIGDRWRNRLVVGGITLALLIGAIVTYVTVVEVRHERQQAVIGDDLKRIVERIDDDRGVMGVRAVRLMSVNPHVKLVTGSTEEQMVMYLTWPSDGDVIRLLRSRDVGWVVVLTDRRLEVDYHNTWVEPVHGTQVRHVDMIEASPSFCEVARTAEYILYRVGACPA